jgi:hypothetical protein
MDSSDAAEVEELLGEGSDGSTTSTTATQGTKRKTQQHVTIDNATVTPYNGKRAKLSKQVSKSPEEIFEEGGRGGKSAAGGSGIGGGGGGGGGGKKRKVDEAANANANTNTSDNDNDGEQQVVAASPRRSKRG